MLLAQADDFSSAAADQAAGAAGAAIAGTFIGVLIFMWILGIISFIIWLWALIDVIRREFTNPNDKILWLVLILLVPLGALIYLFVGRSKGTIPGAASAPKK